MIHAIDDLDRLLRQVDEARLESVQRLDAQSDTALGRVLREAAKLAHEQIDLACALVRRRLPQAPDGAVDWTDHVARAERVRRVNAVTHVSDAVRPDELVRMYQIARGADALAHPPRQAHVAEYRGPAAVVANGRA